MKTEKDYPKCRTCRHLETDGYGDYCGRIQGGQKETAWLDGSDHDSDLLYMDPDKFGCILHEEKPEEAKP